MKMERGGNTTDYTYQSGASITPYPIVLHRREIPIKYLPLTVIRAITMIIKLSLPLVARLYERYIFDTQVLS